MRSDRELDPFGRRLAWLFGALVALAAAGAIGFAAVEHVSLAYGLAWTLDTLTTVGSIADPRDTGGRLLKALLEIFGIGTLFYGLATMAEFFVSGQLSGLLARRRSQRMIDSLSDHYIVCSYGRVGRQVVRDLRAEGAEFVVIDENPDSHEAARADGVPFLDGSPADDAVLHSAGIDRARGVLACVDSDAENIFITLTARQLRSDILIVARASADHAETKMMHAGADRVISPYKSSGRDMARIALHPQISSAITDGGHRIEEIEVTPNCAGAGRTIGEVRGEAMIVAVLRPDGTMEPQPGPQHAIRPGERVFALGSPAALARLESFFQPAAAATE